jgi:uncharacterized protein YbcI
MTNALSPAETESAARAGEEIKVKAARQEKIKVKDRVEVVFIGISVRILRECIRSNGVKTP